MVRFFDLIEQDHGIRATPYRLGEIAALLVTHVTRGRTDESRHGVLFHEFRHVDADHGVLGVEHEFRQRLAQFGLAHTGGAHEKERTDGTIRIGQPCP